jgi:TPR repeat protein
MFARRSFITISSAVVLAGTTGCSPGLFAFSTPDYDAQACVEDALLKKTDQRLAGRAGREFQDACEKGEAAACSALGVLAETGQGRATDANEAARLYTRACQQGNERGCVNLSRVELSGKIGPVDSRAAIERLDAVCSNGEAFACEELGRRLSLGDSVPQDMRRARSLMEKACTRKRAAACYDLALLDAPPGGAPNAWTTELFVEACVGGHQPACERLDVKQNLAGALQAPGAASDL